MHPQVWPMASEGLRLLIRQVWSHSIESAPQPNRNTFHWNGLTTTAACAWHPVSAAHKALSPIAGDTAP